MKRRCRRTTCSGLSATYNSPVVGMTSSSRRQQSFFRRELKECEDRYRLLNQQKNDLQRSCDDWIQKLKDLQREKVDLEEKLERAMRMELEGSTNLVKMESEQSRTRKQLELDNQKMQMEKDTLQRSLNAARTGGENKFSPPVRAANERH